MSEIAGVPSAQTPVVVRDTGRSANMAANMLADSDRKEAVFDDDEERQALVFHEVAHWGGLREKEVEELEAVFREEFDG